MSRGGRRGPAEIRNVGIVFFVRNAQASEQTEAVGRWLEERHIGVILEQECGATMDGRFPQATFEEMLRRVDVLIAVGGDGTLLHAARHAALSGTPLLGINKGTVGFLTELSPHRAIAGLQRLIDGDYYIESRMMLEVRVIRKRRTMYAEIALNDAVVKREMSRIQQYDISLGGTFLDSFPGDGIIVATPTGSTAYSLAAGGPIVKPDLSVLLICPVCAHRFFGRSLIVDSSDTVDITFRRRETEGEILFDPTSLTVDGQTGFTLDAGDLVRIRRSKHRTDLVRFPDTDFFQILRTKLS